MSQVASHKFRVEIRINEENILSGGLDYFANHIK